MKIQTKRWIVAAGILVCAGLVLFCAVMTVYRWDFTKLSTVQYVTNTHEITERFSDLSILTDTADISFVPSEDGSCRVVCTEESGCIHTVSVTDGRLTIALTDSRKWYEHIGINFGHTSITVTMPEGEYGMLQLRSDTGDIRIPDAFRFTGIDGSLSTGNVSCAASVDGSVKIKATTGNLALEGCEAAGMELSVSTGRVTASDILLTGELVIHVSTGKTELTDVRCDTLRSEGSTGRIHLENVIAEKMLSVRRTTGDIVFKACDAGELFIKTDTGDVSGSLCTGKSFSANTDTGYVQLPDNTGDGRCEITTSTGDIRIEVLSK